jgi:hypothetical protein
MRVTTRRGDITPAIYLRAAQAYMLISMPTGTSTIFGAFQAISISFGLRRTFASSEVNYRAGKSSPAESFVLDEAVQFLQVRRPDLKSGVAAVKSTNS